MDTDWYVPLSYNDSSAPTAASPFLRDATKRS